MKAISVGMQTMLNCAGGAGMTLTTLMIITRNDGEVFRFTALDKSLDYGGHTYRAALGHSRSDTQATDALDVDNSNITGPLLTDDGITEADLRAGKWDRAAFRVFMVNYENLAHGEIKGGRGWLGEVTSTRNRFEAELRGIMQAYSRVIGRIFSPDCDATLGDTRCGINLADSSTVGFTHTGTVEAISDDQLTIYDSARTEPGPSGSIGILGITQAQPGVVTTDGPHGYIEGQSVAINGAGGMTPVNTVQVVHNPGADTFEIIDTTDFPAYTSGGTVNDFADSGWFDFGVITMLDGAAARDRMEVKSYVPADSSGPGAIVLQLPMPHTVAPGDTYSIVAGCDKTFSTCVGKFNNGARNRGFPHLRGNDVLVQTGRHNG